MLTKSFKVIIASLGRPCKVCDIVDIPGFCIMNVCFFYPGVNSSTTNRFKKRLFLLFQGVPASFRPNA